MISFASDYIAGAHPDVLKRLCETNLEVLSGYGTDKYCAAATEKIKAACGCPDAEVYFVSGGTQANQLVIGTMVGPTEGVIAAKTGHVSLHEAGAIEYTGHKVLELNSSDGKITAEEIESYINRFYSDGNHDHMVAPGMVYISFPTEYGTLYTKNELTAILSVCRSHEIPFFIDGARMGYGLASRQNDLTLEDIATLCDVFYIGGTKLGALCGEAIVFPKGNSPKRFFSQIKQHGALLAKGRLFGVQFDALFTNDLYMKISEHAIDAAEELKAIFKEQGFEFFIDSPTNQQFIILKNEQMEELKKSVEFSFWESLDDDHTVVRFATSWSTTDDDLAALRDILSNLSMQTKIG